MRGARRALYLVERTHDRRLPARPPVLAKPDNHWARAGQPTPRHMQCFVNGPDALFGLGFCDV